MIKNLLYTFNTSVRAYLPIIILMGALLLVVIGVLGEFLFGSKLLLFADIGSDTYYSYYTFYYLFTNYISNGYLPFWSFKIGAGSSVITLYQFLYDPFSVIYYLVGVENISRSIAWVFVLKSFCAALFTYLYLWHLGVGIYARIVASVLFAFNGFLMIWGQHFFFGSWVIFLPLLLYTIEIWLKSNSWIPMALCVSFMALNIAIFFQVTVFIGLYILIRLSIDGGKHSKRERVINLIKFASIYILGLGLSAVLWLPEYYLLKSSPRISVNFFHALTEIMTNFLHLNTQDYYYSLLSRIFSNNLQGVGSEYTGFLNYYESIQLYVGVLPLLLMPQLYSVFSSRSKWVASFALLSITAILILPGFSQIMNGFQYPSYRWGYNVIMFELVLAALVLNSMLKQKKINLPILVATGFVLFTCIALLNLNSGRLDSGFYQSITIKSFELIGFIVCYSIILCLLVKGKFQRFIFLLLLALICTELILEHRDSFVKRSVFVKGIEQDKNINFFDYGNDAAQYLKATDPSIYRVDKNHWILSLSDSLVQNYYGLDAYNSLNTPSYQNFLQQFGYKGSSNVIKWNSFDHPYLADILSVKYHWTKNIEKLPHDVTFKAKFGDVSIYERNTHLPFGFTYETYFTQAVYNQFEVADRERALIYGAVLEEKPPVELKEITLMPHTQEDNATRTALKRDVLNVIEMHEDKIIGSIKVNNSKLLFLSIPFDRGWTAYVNGNVKDIQRVNFGFSGLYLDKGDNKVELNFTPPYMKLGAMVSILILILSAFFVIFQIRSKKKSGD